MEHIVKALRYILPHCGSIVLGVVIGLTLAAMWMKWRNVLDPIRQSSEPKEWIDLRASVQAARTCFGLGGEEGFRCALEAAERRCGPGSATYAGLRVYVRSRPDAEETVNFHNFRCANN
jgi:hypothetical protein